jgi:uncharacterized protein YndB with AHSA1/START domain
MTDILHRLSIDAPPERVHELVASPAGIQRWWTGHTVGSDGGAGGRLLFSFGGPDPAAVVEVTENTPEQVVWHVLEGPPDWIGTDITFTFRPTDEGTTLLFAHGGWREPSEFMANCSSEWASYLIGLKVGVEGGTFTPYPAGQVSRWG